MMIVYLRMERFLDRIIYLVDAVNLVMNVSSDTNVFLVTVVSLEDAADLKALVYLVRSAYLMIVVSLVFVKSFEEQCLVMAANLPDIAILARILSSVTSVR